MRTTVAILCVLILQACGPAAKLRRAERLIKKAESQGATWSNDTVYKQIPILVPKIHMDTLIEKLNFTDTIVVTKNRVITKIKVDTVNKTIYVSTDCPEKTVTVKVPVAVHKTIEAKTWVKWWHILVAFAAGYILRGCLPIRGKIF